MLFKSFNFKHEDSLMASGPDTLRAANQILHLISHETERGFEVYPTKEAHDAKCGLVSIERREGKARQEVNDNFESIQNPLGESRRIARRLNWLRDHASAMSMTDSRGSYEDTSQG